MAFLERNPVGLESSDGGWLNPKFSFREDSNFGACLSVAKQYTIENTNFGAIPSTVDIVGIEVFLDCKKDETGGTGTLKFDIDLSWDDGQWTTAKQHTLDLSLLTKKYGVPNDTWGHAWTRDEITGSFMVRVKTAGTIATGAPQWEAHWLRVRVHYNETSAINLSLEESTGFFETLATSPMHANFVDSVAVINEGTGALQISGTAIDDIKTDSEFTAATEQFWRREAMGLWIFIFGVPKLFQIGDVFTQESSDTASGAGSYQEGVFEWGDITFDGKFGVPSDIPSATVRVRRGEFADFVGATTTLEAAFRNSPVEGGWGRIYLFLQDTTGSWLKSLAFDGIVERHAITDEYIEFELRLEGRESTLTVPTVIVNEELFNYGNDEGELPEEWVGAGVPFGYGSFNIKALKGTGGGGSTFNLAETYNTNSNLSGIGYPSMLGVKVPAMPVVLGAEKYIRKSGSTLNNAIPQAMFLQGSTIRSPNIYVQSGFTPALNFLFTVARNVNDPNNNHLYSVLHTWNGEYDRAVFVINDYGTDQPPVHRDFAGVQDWRAVQSSFTTGFAQATIPLAVGVGTPRWEQGTVVNRWGGVQAVIALPMNGLANETTAGTSPVLGIWTDPNVAGLDPSTAAVRCTLTDFAAISEGEAGYAASPEGPITRATFIGPLSGPPLGALQAVRFCVLDNLLTPSTRSTYKMKARWGGGGIADSLDLYVGINVIDDGTGVKINNTATDGYFAAYMKRITDPFIQRSPILDNGNVDFSLAEGAIAPWQFTHITNLGTFGVQQEVAAELTIELPADESVPRDLAQLRKVWVEAIFKFPFGSRENIRVPTSASRMEAARPGGINWGGVAQAAVFGYDSGARLTNPDVPSRAVPLPYTGNIKESEAGSIGLSPWFILGDGPIDDAAGTYTGSGSTPFFENVVERGCDIFGHLTAHFLAELALVPTGADFGSLTTARTALTSHRMVMAVSQRTLLRNVFERIGAQSKSFIQRQVRDTIGTELRMFVDDDDPETNQPGRMYRTDGFLFRWDHIVPNSFKVEPFTTRSDIKSEFLLEYAYSLQTGRFERSKYCSPAGSNFSTDASTYEGACSSAEANYDIQDREITFQAPDVWDDDVAEDLLKWYINNRRTMRHGVEFDTRVNAHDLRPGHVIKFDDSIKDDHETGLGIPYPGQLGGVEWSSHQWNVVRTAIKKDQNTPIAIHVIAIETYTTAT